MIRVRASGVPLMMLCTMSADVSEGDVLIDEHNEAADLGNAVHHLLSHRVRGITVPRFDETAEQYHCDVDELGMLFRFGERIWGAVQDWFPEPSTDVAVQVQRQEFTITGELDVMAVKGRTLRVLDWKSGRVEKMTRGQLLTYAAMVMEYWPEPIDTVQLFTAWLRKRAYDTITVTREEVEKWLDEVARIARNGQGVYSPGTHCMECRHQHHCEGYRTQFQSIISKAAALTPIEMTPETVLASGIEIANMLAMGKQIAAYMDDLRAHLRTFIADHGPIPIMDGMSLMLTTQRRSEINTTDAIAEMGSVGLNHDEINATLTVSKDAMLKAVKSKAPRGSKTAAAEVFIKRLEDTGAITYKPTHMLVEGVPLIEKGASDAEGGDAQKDRGTTGRAEQGTTEPHPSVA